MLPLTRSHYYGVPFVGSLVITVLPSTAHSVSTPQDLFGRMKIPDINALAPAVAMYSDNDWVLVQNSSGASYTSILGVPIAGLPGSGNASFSITTHYWSVSCTSQDHWKNRTWSPALLPSDTNITSLNPMSPSFEIEDVNGDKEVDILHWLLSMWSRDGWSGRGCMTEVVK
jgi:hypothetical protein